MRNLERASNNGPRGFHFGHVRCHVIKFQKNKIEPTGDFVVNLLFLIKKLFFGVWCYNNQLF